MNAYEEWELQQRHSGSLFHLNMTPEEQAVYRKRIIEGCIGIGDCWVWAGAKTEDGYGNIRVGNATRIVSRLAKCLDTDASLSITLDACHIAECPSRACCNPRHLYWGEHQPNCAMRESRDARWERYMTTMHSPGTIPFVVFEKRYQKGWGWLDCRTVHTGGRATSRIITHTMPNPMLEAV
jgi:hypothetical protein